MKCSECGVQCPGLVIKVDGHEEYVPDLCAQCLMKLSEEAEAALGAAAADIDCPKCGRPTVILRNDECIACYENRCEQVLKVSMEEDYGEPPLGWNYPNEDIDKAMEYARITGRKEDKRES